MVSLERAHFQVCIEEHAFSLTSQPARHSLVPLGNIWMLTNGPWLAAPMLMSSLQFASQIIMAKAVLALGIVKRQKPADLTWRQYFVQGAILSPTVGSPSDVLISIDASTCRLLMGIGANEVGPPDLTCFCAVQSCPMGPPLGWTLVFPTSPCP